MSWKCLFRGCFPSTRQPCHCLGREDTSDPGLWGEGAGGADSLSLNAGNSRMLLKGTSLYGVRFNLIRVCRWTVGLTDVSITSTSQGKEPSRRSRPPEEARVGRWPGKTQGAQPSVTAIIKDP